MFIYLAIASVKRSRWRRWRIGEWRQAAFCSFIVLAGLRIGATAGFLHWFGVDFLLYGLTNLSNLAATVAYALLSIIPYGRAGAVIVAVVGRRALSSARDVM